MPTSGIQRRPASSRTSGFTNRAANRTTRRARGPRLIVMMLALIEMPPWCLSLMNQGRRTAGECDFGGRCHTSGPAPVLIYVAASVIESNERFADAWASHHRFLLDVAYRLLGSYSDAEDIVQEGFSRLLRTDLDPIEDVRAWLVVVVSRLCLDQLRSSRVKREAYIGPWFPEPLLFADDAAIDPADVVTMDESVRFALLVVLERMSPAERVVFVLHDVFDFPFEKIAPMVGRTVAA